MLVKIYGSAVYGVEAITITIEVNVTQGLYTFVVGLADNAVKESIRRVESAIKTNGFYMPRTKVIVNLAPAGIRKSGPAFDLPIAIGVLVASSQIHESAILQETVIMGELGLDGTIQPIKGMLPIAIQASRDQFKSLIIPSRNAKEASLIGQLQVHGFNHLRDVITFLHKANGKKPTDRLPTDRLPTDRRVTSATSTSTTPATPATSETPSILSSSGSPMQPSVPLPDFAEVKGQEIIKRALEIAAAGGHNAILIGPPGAGKSMLAKRLPSILPPLTLEEALETTRIHSVAGKLPEDILLLRDRPFRHPHHTISAMALLGGGAIPQPGEISLAHNGVLFLDELPEFDRKVLEVMRQPIEEKKVTISRAKMSVDFPSSFILLASMNPCPCGYYNHPERECTCPPGAVAKYLNRVSGPLLDRIDLHVEVVPVPYSRLSVLSTGESSGDIKKRVMVAREIQLRRYETIHTEKKLPWTGDISSGGAHWNARMSGSMLNRFCTIDDAGHKLLQAAMEKLGLSARAHDHLLKLARTIADLEGKDDIRAEHLAEAIQYRSLDRRNWGS